MADFYSDFVSLCLQQCLEKDYACRKKINIHNKATIALHRMMNEIEDLSILKKLLSHPDSRVKLNAASACLRYSFCIEEAISVLDSLVDGSPDSTIQLSAKMVLKNKQKTENSSKPLKK